MRQLARNLAISGALFIGAGYLVPVLRSWWFQAMFRGQRFSVPFVWLDPSHALIWLFEFSWSLVAGLILGLLLRSSRVVGWAFVFGILSGVLHFVRAHDVFGAGAHWSSYVWAYGQYIVPGLGAAAGAALVVWLLRAARGVKPNAA